MDEEKDEEKDEESDDRHKQEPVQIRIPEDLKDEWAEDVAETYGSYKNLITTAVYRERNDEYVLKSEVYDVAEAIVSSEDFAIDFSTVESQLIAMQTVLDDLSSVVLREGDNDEIGMDELSMIAMRAETALMHAPSEDVLRSLETGVELPIQERVKITGYPEDVALFIGEDDVWKVRQALIWLETMESTSNVKSFIDDDGRRRFFVRDTSIDPPAGPSELDMSELEDYDLFGLKDGDES